MAGSETGRLIPSIARARTRDCRHATALAKSAWRITAAHCPVFARCCPKIPFFCRAADTPRGLISPLGAGKWGDCHMTIKASGRSALIVAAGLFVCFAGPLPATAAGSDSAAASKSDSATSGKSVRHSARHWKRHAHRKYSQDRAKSDRDQRQGRRKGRRRRRRQHLPAIPASVANANAQMTATDAPRRQRQRDDRTRPTRCCWRRRTSRPTQRKPAADAAVVASDQLNDVDRALQRDARATQTVAMAAVKPAAAAPRDGRQRTARPGTRPR